MDCASFHEVETTAGLFTVSQKALCSAVNFVDCAHPLPPDPTYSPMLLLGLTPAIVPTSSDRSLVSPS